MQKYRITAIHQEDAFYTNGDIVGLVGEATLIQQSNMHNPGEWVSCDFDANNGKAPYYFFAVKLEPVE